MAFSPHNEKRAYPRMRLPAGLSFRLPGHDKTYIGVCRDLSHSGICFESWNALEEGSVVEITIDTGHRRFTPFRASIEVVRSEKGGNLPRLIAGRITRYV